MRLLGVCALALRFIAPAVLASQAVVRGRIIDARTAAPVRDALVIVTSGRDTLAQVRSDSGGVFQSSLAAPGTVVAHFSRFGYRTDSVSAVSGAEMPLRVAMIPLGGATALAAVVVRDSTRSGFEQRARRYSGGTFLRLADIEKRHAVQTADLFRFLPGITLADSAGTTLVVSTRGSRSVATPNRTATASAGRGTATVSGQTTRVCSLRVGTDGHLMPRDYSIDNVRLEDIFAIELYLGAATIPLEFASVQRDGPCGVIMIWTKTGNDHG